MPLTLDQDDVQRLKEVVNGLPMEVRSGTIELYGGQTFTFKWDDSVGHILTWKEPRK